jgi:excisionase family DNA binding protein
LRTTLEFDIQELASQVATQVGKAIKPILDQYPLREDLLFDVQELAEYLSVSTQWVYERVQLKEIPYIKVGKLLRFRKPDINTWLDGLKVPPMSPLSSVPNSLHNPKKLKVTT